jgi:hypothetical protein
MTELPKHIQVMARAICREKCAFMGEPPCFAVMDGSPFTWLPETCCEPGCISEATAAHAALVEAGFVVMPREPTNRDLRRRVIAATLEAAAKRGDRERIAYDEEADAAIAVVLEEAAKIVVIVPANWVVRQQTSRRDCRNTI